MWRQAYLLAFRIRTRPLLHGKTGDAPYIVLGFGRQAATLFRQPVAHPLRSGVVGGGGKAKIAEALQQIG